MRTLTALATIFTFSHCLSQPITTFTPSQIEAGKTTAGDMVPALSFDLGQILLYDVNTVTNEMVTISRPSKAKSKYQLMTLWDIRKKTPLWTIEVPNPSLEVVLTENAIFRYDGKKTTCHRKTDGTVNWGKRDKLIGLRENRDLAVDHDGDVINVKNGTVITNTQTEHDFGLNEVLPAKNNTLVIAADGLFGINTATGEKWGFPSKTGWNYHGGNRNDAANTTIVVASAVAFGLVGGIVAAAATGQLGDGNTATIANRGNSNIVVRNNTAYFASLENLIEVDIPSGKKRFETPLPGAKTSSSLMRVDDNAIYLLNLGYVATDKGSRLFCGHPFFASYNKTTGVQNFLDSLGPKGAVAAANYIGDTMFINYNNKYITGTELKTGSRILTAEIKPGGLPQVVLFMDPTQHYVERKGGVFNSLQSEYPGLLFVKDKANFIYAYNIATKTTEYFQRATWQPVKVKGKTVMQNSSGIAFLKDGKNFALINMENSIIAGGTAVGVSKSSLTFVNIEALLN